MQKTSYRPEINRLILALFLALTVLFALYVYQKVQEASDTIQGAFDSGRYRAFENSAIPAGVWDSLEADQILEKTPMAGMGPRIVTVSNDFGVDWRLLIGIAAAESSLGKVGCYNFWGISPFRCYNSFDESLRVATNLLATRYRGQTAEQLCGVYVQPCTERWLSIVQSYEGGDQT